jgi:hypothetical protein
MPKPKFSWSDAVEALQSQDQQGQPWRYDPTDLTRLLRRDVAQQAGSAEPERQAYWAAVQASLEAASPATGRTTSVRRGWWPLGVAAGAVLTLRLLPAVRLYRR